jgi:hypothetical protein
LSFHVKRIAMHVVAPKENQPSSRTQEEGLSLESGKGVQSVDFRGKTYVKLFFRRYYALKIQALSRD